eukprot:COSAG01_NODE_21519_length_898_cov_1.533166_1_plen_104_part_01
MRVARGGGCGGCGGCHGRGAIAAAAAAAAARQLVVARVPLQEAVPISHDARPQGPRSMQWHPTCPSTLIWVAALDGGDPKNEPGKGGFRDMLYTQTVNLGGGGG